MSKSQYLLSHEPNRISFVVMETYKQCVSLKCRLERLVVRNGSCFLKRFQVLISASSSAYEVASFNIEIMLYICSFDIAIDFSPFRICS